MGRLTGLFVDLLQHVVINELGNGFTLSFAGVLVRPEVNSAIDTGVGDIVRYVSQIGIAEYDTGNGGVLDGDRPTVRQ